LQSDKGTETDRLRDMDMQQHFTPLLDAFNPGMVSIGNVYSVLRDRNVWVRES
jgi:hypothetical protein